MERSINCCEATWSKQSPRPVRLAMSSPTLGTVFSCQKRIMQKLRTIITSLVFVWARFVQKRSCMLNPKMKLRRAQMPALQPAQSQRSNIYFLRMSGEEKCLALSIKNTLNGRFCNVEFQNFPGGAACPRTPKRTHLSDARGNGLWPLFF